MSKRAHFPTSSGVFASSPGVIERPEVEEGPSKLGSKGWIVTVFDNDYNTYDQVMSILMLATGCTSDEAYIESWEIDHYGKCVVHQGLEKECQRAADVIGSIGIKVEVTKE